MPTEKCAYCEEMVELPYGYGVSCPRCGERMDIFDDDHPLMSPFEIKRESIARRSALMDAPSKTPSLKRNARSDESSVPGVSYLDIGGLDRTIAELDLLVNGAMRYPEVWKHLGRKHTRGILLYGPSGCGKTLLAQAIAGAGKRKCCVVQGAEIKGGLVGASEHNLIREYKSVAPDGILIIDEIDALGGKRETMVNETSVGITDTLCSLLDGAKYKDHVVVIGTTNQPDLLDTALRRPGRFDIEVYVPPPDEEGRKHIFAIHTRGMPLAPDMDFSQLAARSAGFTGADIAGVCSRVSKQLLASAARNLEAGIGQEEVIQELFVAQEQFIALIANTVPSVLREGFVSVSKVRWNEIGGLADVKKELQRVILWPVKYASLMKGLKLRQPKGMLLYGPPGCGKTLLAKAIAGESGCNLLVVNGPALVNQMLGNTEAAIRNLFRKARQAAPCIIFFDEIEAIAPVRGRSMSNDALERAVSQLLAEIDGVQTLTDVFVIAATNRPDLVDPALLRPGRLDLQYEIGNPDTDGRKEIFAIHLEGIKLYGISIAKLTELTPDYSGAEIEWLCTTIKKCALERCIASGNLTVPKLTRGDAMQALQEVNKRVYS